jgi:NAD(P)-dependent dehydrogenase (short-subunit alcohol dehydrogenase family)
MSLKDKNVVVTGGSRGLDLGLVEALVAHGARVTVVARAPKRSIPSAPGWASPRSPPILRTRPHPTASLPNSAQTSWR